MLAVLVGAALIVAGMVRLFEAFRPREEDAGKRVAYAVIGLLGIVVGVYCLKDQGLTVLVLGLVGGAFWVVHGIADLAVAWSAPKGTPGRGLRALTGALSLAAGIVMLAWTACRWPYSSRCLPPGCSATGCCSSCSPPGSDGLPRPCSAFQSRLLLTR